MGLEATFPWRRQLGLRPGELVEVRSREEVLRTLDSRACLDGLPFMPEMFQYCGRRFHVSKRSEKACDTIVSGQGRRVRDAVFLENLRCDGAAHGGCQALCLLWWREGWLKRVDATATADAKPGEARAGCTEQDVERATRLPGDANSEVLYSCQATRLLDFTEYLRWWDPLPYLREFAYGNVGLFKGLAVILRAAMNVVRRRIGLLPRPSIRGYCEGQTPAGTPLGLKHGDWVVVRSKEEIEATLNLKKFNRGLSFDVEMLPYCGKRMQLLQKVERIIDETNGKMRVLSNDCWILEGSICSGHLSRNRLFCTRALYPFWRGIWLRPDTEAGGGASAPSQPRA